MRGYRGKQGLRGMWRSTGIEQVREIQRGGFAKWKAKRRGKRVQEESEEGLVMRRGRVHSKEKKEKRRKRKKRNIYLQLPCEMLIGSLSSGKPAPAICSSVK